MPPDESPAEGTQLVERGNPATRATLMDAAERLLERKTILETTVDDLVQEAGVARGTFYIYFKDRFDLLAAVSRRRNERLFSESHLRIDHVGSAYERIRLSLRRVIKDWEQHHGLYLAETQMALTRPDFLALNQELRMPFVRQIRRDLDRSIERGHARPIDTAVAAKALAAMMDWFCLLWFGLGEPPYPEAERNIDHVADHLALLWYRSVYGADPAQGTAGPSSESESDQRG